MGDRCAGTSRYYARRLFKRYRCEFRLVKKPQELSGAFDALIHLHIAQWSARNEVGSLSDPVFQTFLRRTASDSLAAGRLRMWTLRIEEKVEAVLLGFLDRGVLHYFQKGHNPTFLREDLGTALVSLCVRDCCDDPAIRAFDFMGGGSDYKSLWARQARGTVLREVSRGTLGARAFTLHLRLRAAATAAYRAVAPLSIRSARREWLRARAS